MKALLLNASPKNNGNTARLLELIGDAFHKKGMETQTLCLGDLHYAFCKGCRSCYQTAECVQHDDVQLVLEQMEQADLIAIASPTIGAGSPASLGVHRPRTPYSPAHQPHAALSMGKRGISIALSAREDPRECKEILARIDRFFQRMGIRPMANYYTCGVLTEDDLNNNEGKLAEVTFFGEEIAKTLMK
ncbi:MAG: flavodoxin family protein [Anaeromassilibacillus sp.]